MDTFSQKTFPIIVLKDEEGFFVATNVALAGCHSQGKSIEEALANIREATALCLEENGTEVAKIEEVSVHLIAA